jgi:hypothetical protein
VGIGQNQSLSLKNKAASLPPLRALRGLLLLLGHAKKLAKQGVVEQPSWQASRSTT